MVGVLDGEVLPQKKSRREIDDRRERYRLTSIGSLSHGSISRYIILIRRRPKIVDRGKAQISVSS